MIWDRVGLIAVAATFTGYTWNAPRGVPEDRVCDGVAVVSYLPLPSVEPAEKKSDWSWPITSVVEAVEEPVIEDSDPEPRRRHRRRRHRGRSR